MKNLFEAGRVLLYDLASTIFFLIILIHICMLSFLGTVRTHTDKLIIGFSPKTVRLPLGELKAFLPCEKHKGNDLVLG